MQPILFALQQKRGFTNQRASARGIAPLRANLPMPQQPPLDIIGVTRDSTGAVLASCEVELYVRATDQTFGTYVSRTISDGSGNFGFRVGLGRIYQHIAYKPGSPDVAGISLRTLVGV